MAKMAKKIMETLERSTNVVVATVSNEGIPNAVPIGSKKILNEETVLFSNQFFNKNLKNILHNGKVAFTFWDKVEGYQLKGSVTIETKGKIFEETAQWIENLGKKLGKPLKSKGAFILKIEEIYQVTSGEGAGQRLA